MVVVREQEGMNVWEFGYITYAQKCVLVGIALADSPQYFPHRTTQSDQWCYTIT